MDAVAVARHAHALERDELEAFVGCNAQLPYRVIVIRQRGEAVVGPGRFPLGSKSEPNACACVKLRLVDASVGVDRLVVGVRALRMGVPCRGGLRLSVRVGDYDVRFAGRQRRDGERYARKTRLICLSCFDELDVSSLNLVVDGLVVRVVCA